MPGSPQVYSLVLTGGSSARTFTAAVYEENGVCQAEQSFEWRYDSVALNLDLSELAQYAISGSLPKDDLHIRFGQQLYHSVFSGAVEKVWQEARKQAGSKGLRLVVRVDPQIARPLLDLPWEYLHDGKEFLALNRRIFLSRLPLEIEERSVEPLDEPIRLLIVVSAPNGLSQDEVLNTALEEDILLAATSDARRTNRMQVEFTPNGSFSTLQTYTQEYDPHIVHFVGHGVFEQSRDLGFLLMEDDQGNRLEVKNEDFANALIDNCTNLRLVTLTACQSAMISSNTAVNDLGPRLLSEGIPAIVAMQFSVIHRSAVAFWEGFYKGIANQKAVDEALVDARRALTRTSPNAVDFATPVLYTFEPLCLQIDAEAASKKTQVIAPTDMSGVTRSGNFVGRSVELRELATKLDPETGQWRAAIIHGLGGMGKTVLAARLAERMGSRLEGVKTIRMAPSTTAIEVLNSIGEFLLVHNARFNLPAIPQFHQTLQQPVSLESKTGALIPILERLKLLVIFDNCEDILPAGQALSRAAQTVEQASQPATPVLDAGLLKLFSILVGSVSRPSRFLFTCRMDFDPVDQGRLVGEIGHLDLGEMGATDAIYLMETLPSLSNLPVSSLNGNDPTGVTKRQVYERLSGHPYTLGLFASHAARSNPAAVLQDLSGVHKELLEFTLMGRAVAKLSERAKQILLRGAILDEPVEIEGFAYLLGDEKDCMPDISAEAVELQRWGLLSQPPGTDLFALHSLAKDWARVQLEEEKRQDLLKRAAGYWLGVGKEAGSVTSELNAWHYLFAAKLYEQAGDVVMGIFEYLLRWGEIELLLRLMQACVDTLQGTGRAEALHNMGVVFQNLGEYQRARELYQQSITTQNKLGKQSSVAKGLHQLGILHEQLGEYDQARKHYQKSLAIFTENGDQAGMAGTLHQLGTLHHQRGEYDEAREFYQQSLTIEQNLGNQTGVAISLNQLGILHRLQGDYKQATQNHQQSLVIAEELGDRAGIAKSLYQLGMLYQQQGEYELAFQHYQQSLSILTDLGDRAGVARSRRQLGMLHQKQGEYEQAAQCYLQSLSILNELGDRAGVASTLAQHGLLAGQLGKHSQAVAFLLQAHDLFEQLDMPQQKQALRALQHLRDIMGEVAFSEAVQDAQGDALGVE